MINYQTGPWPPEGFILVPGKCPVAESNPGMTAACNCTGACRSTLVRLDKDGKVPVESLPDEDTVWTVPNH